MNRLDPKLHRSLLSSVYTVCTRATLPFTATLGKTERRPMGSHLGLGLLVEAAPRRGVGGGDAIGGGGGAREGCGGSVVR
jgi:hypothetical protein